MSYRNHLPQLDGALFLTDGGIETVLIFHEGLDLPAFAAFDLLKDDAGTATLRRYYDPYATLAREHGLGFVLESPTWRASPRWAAQLGYTDADLTAVQPPRDRADGGGPRRPRRRRAGRDQRLRRAARTTATAPGETMSADAAQEYHATQIETFADTARDMVTAVTHDLCRGGDRHLPRRARGGIPAAISFTVETDGRLPSGQTLAEAIEQVDERDRRRCRLLHDQLRAPDHFVGAQAGGVDATGSAACAPTRRRKSHAELDEAEELDNGDPDDLGARYAALRERLPPSTCSAAAAAPITAT